MYFGWLSEKKENNYLPTQFQLISFSGAFEKLRMVTTCFVMSVRLFVYPHETTRLPLEDVHEI